MQTLRCNLNDTLCSPHGGGLQGRGAVVEGAAAPARPELHFLHHPCEACGWTPASTAAPLRNHLVRVKFVMDQARSVKRCAAEARAQLGGCHCWCHVARARSGTHWSLLQTFAMTGTCAYVQIGHVTLSACTVVAHRAQAEQFHWGRAQRRAGVLQVPGPASHLPQSQTP